MKIQEMIAKAGEIRRMATFNRKTGQIKVAGKAVKHIPCYRCGGTGSIKLGNDAFAGVGRCGVCQGRKILTGDDIVRNMAWAENREEEAVSNAAAVFAEFEKMAKVVQVSA